VGIHAEKRTLRTKQKRSRDVGFGSKKHISLGKLVHFSTHEKEGICKGGGGISKKMGWAKRMTMEAEKRSVVVLRIVEIKTEMKNQKRGS